MRKRRRVFDGDNVYCLLLLVVVLENPSFCLKIQAAAEAAPIAPNPNNFTERSTILFNRQTRKRKQKEQEESTVEVASEK